MLKTKLAKKVLTKAEQRHLSVDANIHTLAAMKRQVEFIKKADPDNRHIVCFECRVIARKLGLLD